MLPVSRKSCGGAKAAQGSKSKHDQANHSLRFFTSVFQPIADNRQPGYAYETATEQKDPKKYDRTQCGCAPT